MRFVNIFIASSINEFDQTRIFVGDFIRQFNEDSVKKGFQIKLFLCEDEFQNSQPVYDRQIQNSDIFIAIIGQVLGVFTQHEIYDIAYNCKSIKEKLIILASTESHKFLHSDREHVFRYLQCEDDVLTLLLSEIQTAIMKVLPEIMDVPTLPSKIHYFRLNLPKISNIECAVLGNIIRRVRDQGNGIIVSNNITSNDAYVGLLTSEYDEEKRRILNYINEGVSVDLLWLFINNSLLTDNDINTSKTMKELTSCLNGKYFDTYQSYKNLSTIFENKLLGALIRHNLLDGSAFVYIVQDHWLLRKGSASNNSCINLLNSGFPADSEEQSRKERVITNLLNYYWLNGKTEKHIMALKALQQSNYEYFAYSAEDLEEISLKRSEYKQAAIDYVCDRLEWLQLNLSKFESEDILSQIKQLLQMPLDEGVTLPPESAFLIYRLAYGLLSFYSSLLRDAYQFLKECWFNYQRIPTPLPKFVEGGKLCILQLCQVSAELSLVKEEQQWLSVAETMYDGIDDWYKANVLLRKKNVFRNNNAKIEEQCEKELCSIFQPDFISKNNSNLNLYLQYRYSCIWKDFNNIYRYREEIMFLLNKYYVPFLSEDNNYLQTGMLLLSLCALSGPNQESNIELCDSIIMHYNDSRKEKDKGIDYYNLLFTKAVIYRDLKENQKAIELFKKVSELYRGDRDKGCCHQNIALCYMSEYTNNVALSMAEASYLCALEYFTKVQDVYMIGNIYDGLSYCCLLQNKYQEANKFAMKSLEITEYDTPNKYANYISSLLCLGLYSEAVDFYNIQKKHSSIMLQIKNDYDHELSDLKICIESFDRFIQEHTMIDFSDSL
ncbi:MAG: hypothetical protein J6P74_07910 [Paludibacteraceae bacterium]|nr:hypothetical protein [Paludibacteraceae bacterium]